MRGEPTPREPQILLADGVVPVARPLLVEVAILAERHARALRASSPREAAVLGIGGIGIGAAAVDLRPTLRPVLAPGEELVGILRAMRDEDGEASAFRVGAAPAAVADGDRAEAIGACAAEVMDHLPAV